ncbi:TetR/AcrR family transcriptional regulator [Paenibacillus sp. BSR1-1]|uniref:TetR/AcrR family transcriptional regulator n=1 Tax=Paenibacillus sp. BSR1-1 TaxID=3020845 RepID=UPI0025B0206D|nr:TetR/AcrR family transcriptional regulator [Paenibacillus sp. BSR1-1]MDN3015634.1 TetR/AcrR family transcriptional regulator [Paenibacillus sp. BSR1-1]
MINDENTPRIRTERRDAAKNRQLILDTAHRLFEQFGVEQVSMNQIATEAQIGPGTLYRRYRNKGELCQDLIKDSVDLFFEDIEEYLKENGQVPPHQKLKEILSFFIRFREKKAQLLTGVEEAKSTNPLKPRTKSPLYAELHQILVELFDEMEANENTYSQSAFKADMVLMALSSDSYFFQKDVRGYSPEEILELLFITFIVK